MPNLKLLVNIINYSLFKIYLAICDFYGKEYPNSLTRNEFFFFIDSFFRGLYKILIKTDGKTS